ncbi:transcriptional regulator [Rathayibacter sp. Leaf296]|uniref:transcriptional regulator n=1 Tax=Rathayibacter sp. Leaf296 TaxID=1736327 RepID=UPI0007028541|nr:transcriptional regulator [Rathayibacter sp. Leaf296]KQQ10336.1 transcriptional regulator [Rathayibacter sp. Leaf296]
MSAEARFDEVIHAPLRLRICGLLRAGDGVDFGVLRDTLGVSDATLSKHLKVLADAGFTSSVKSSSSTRSDSRRVTWVSLTRPGAAAFDSHVRALRAITLGE